MILAAGIMFVESGGKALFLKRGPGSDHPGEWCWPGGHVEDGESIEDAAKREAIEELGFLPAGTKTQWTRSVMPIADLPAPDGPPVPPNTKADVDYGPAKPGGDICADCVHFLAPGACALVQGDIDPAGWCRLFKDRDVDYTTYIQRVDSQFEPQISGEHTGWAWCAINEPPLPLHPGCRIALARLDMNETQVAQAVASGELASPQRFENVWLFAMRITGTGAAYRKSIDEYVYRQPEAYLTPEFLERCQGLPVIWQHPPKSLLTSQEYADRVIGSIVCPHIRGDEVWGVAKIYDDEAAELLAAGKLSTSPGVKGGPANRKITLEDGTNLLVEVEPKLLDHLAVCELGVWDKGGDPSGVSSENGVALMSEEEKKAAEEKAAADKARKDAEEAKEKEEKEEKKDAKADAAGGVKPDDKLSEMLDAMCSRLDARFDAFDKRLDAMECDAKARKDAEESEKKEREDKARRDAMSEEERKRDDAARRDAEEKEKREREDKARRDAEEAKEKERKDAEEAKEKAHADSMAKMEAEIAELKKRQPRARTDADRAALAAAQERCDAVAAVWSAQAPRPMDGEEEIDYRIRLANGYKSHSKAWADVDLASLPVNAFAIAEKAIYADAMEAGMRPSDGVGISHLRPISKRDAAGRQITEFVGDPMSWMRPFMSPSQKVREFKIGGKAQ